MNAIKQNYELEGSHIHLFIDKMVVLIRSQLKMDRKGRGMRSPLKNDDLPYCLLSCGAAKGTQPKYAAIPAKGEENIWQAPLCQVPS